MLQVRFKVLLLIMQEKGDKLLSLERKPEATMTWPFIHLDTHFPFFCCCALFFVKLIAGRSSLGKAWGDFAADPDSAVSVRISI